MQILDRMLTYSRFIDFITNLKIIHRKTTLADRITKNHLIIIIIITIIIIISIFFTSFFKFSLSHLC